MAESVALECMNDHEPMSVGSVVRPRVLIFYKSGTEFSVSQGHVGECSLLHNAHRPWETVCATSD